MRIRQSFSTWRDIGEYTEGQLMKRMEAEYLLSQRRWIDWQTTHERARLWSVEETHGCIIVSSRVLVQITHVCSVSAAC